MESVDEKESKRRSSNPQEDQRTTGMDALPWEIALDILTRLPITSLLQFKCVCRSWRTLAQDPRLPDLHLAHATENNPCLILHYDCPIRNQLYVIHNNACHGYDNSVRKIDTPFKSVMPEFDVAGSCNGLLCLSDSLFSDLLYIYNPFTSEHIVLPRTTQYTHQKLVFGFGFHPTTKEYKVVRIVYYSTVVYNYRWISRHGRGYPRSEVQIFTLGTDSWRSIGSARYYVCQRSPVALVNGTLHWVTQPTRFFLPRRSKLIVSFNLADEKFQVVPHPDCNSFGTRNYRLVVLRGSLSAVANCNDGHIDIWVMKDYNVKESWTKEFTIGAYVPTGLNQDIYRPIRIWRNGLNRGSVRVLCLLKNGEILLEYGNQALVSYDPEQEKFTELTIHGLPNWFQSVTHVGSLMPPELAVRVQR